MADAGAVTGFAATGWPRRWRRTGPLCAGIDPSSGPARAAGACPTRPTGCATFGLRCVEAFAGVVPVVKPQVAFFERRGLGRDGRPRVGDGRGPRGRPPGHRRCQAGRHRIDHGGLRRGLAGSGQPPGRRRGHRARPTWGSARCDRPMSTWPAASGPGGDRGGAQLQPRGPRRSRRRSYRSARAAGGGPSVEDTLLEADRASSTAAACAVPGTVGAVVGATLAPSAVRPGRAGGVILAPGLGAQGATAEDVARLFAGCPPGTVLANVSRSLLAAGPDAGSLRRAARGDRRGAGRVRCR